MDGTNGLTASDVALLGNNGGLGGNNGLFWIFALLILAGGGFGGWNRTGDYGQFATAASQQEILFGQQFQNLDNKMDRLGNGIADSTFALNNSVKDGNSMVAGRVVDEGRAMQSQLADCCCTTQRNIDSVRFDMSNYACAIQATDTANTQKILDAIAQNKIETLQGRINQLELQAAMCGVVRYPNSMAYDAGRSPFCNCNSGCYCNM
jgi:hypothetical protein